MEGSGQGEWGVKEGKGDGKGSPCDDRLDWEVCKLCKESINSSSGMMAAPPHTCWKPAPQLEAPLLEASPLAHSSSRATPPPDIPCSALAWAGNYNSPSRACPQPEPASTHR